MNTVNDKTQITADNCFSITNGIFQGQGISNEVNLTCKKVETVLSSSMKNYQIDISDWNLSRINISISNLIAYNSTMGENGTTGAQSLSREALNVWNAMPFVIPYDLCDLYNISVYLTINKFVTTEEIRLEILNATNPSNPQPNTVIFSHDFNLEGTGSLTGWKSLTFEPLALRKSQTVNSTFYVALAIIPAGVTVSWRGLSDLTDPNEFSVWKYSSGVWASLGFDFTLITHNSFKPYPSEIKFSINNTSVTNSAPQKGTWVKDYENPISGALNFEFEANQAFSADFLFEETLVKKIPAVSTFYVQSNWNYVEWNSSATFSYLLDCYDKEAQWLIPNWNIEDVLKGNVPLSHAYWDSSRINDQLLVTINNSVDVTWTIKCNSTNFVKQVTVTKHGMPAMIVNTTDTIEITADFHETLRTGSTNLTVFPFQQAYYNDSIDILLGNTSVQFASWTINNTASSNPGTFQLQVIWYNGTAVGINATSLNVLNVPTNLQLIAHPNEIPAGQSIFVYVSFTNNYTGQPIINPTLKVKNSVDNTLWPNPFGIPKSYSNGTYEIEVITVDLELKKYSLSINMSKPLYLSSEIAYINVTLVGGMSNVSVTAENCRQLKSINLSYALVDPVPYHNSSVKVTIFYYSNSTFEPLRNAVITPTWLEGGPAVSWVSAYFGYYNITIDVTGFHSNTNHTLRISIQQPGYDTAVLYIIVPIRKLPTAIEPLDPIYNNYIDDEITIYAIYQDILNVESIPSVYSLNGNFTLKMGALIDNMSLLAPSLGLYKYDISLSSWGLEEGKTYTITLSAFSSEHEFASINLSLYIVPKVSSSLIIDPLPFEIREGKLLEVKVTLLINGTPAKDEIITFTFTYLGGIDVKTTVTDVNGKATVDFKVPAGITKITVTVTYEGLSYVNGNSTDIETQVISTMTLIWRAAPIWLSILLTSIGVPLGYKYLYRRPRLMRLKRMWQVSGQKFIDANNLNFLMIILKNVGISIYNHSFKGEEIDYQLMGGFLTAITTFQSELMKSDKIRDLEKEIWELNYQTFKIYGITGKFLQFVMILEGSPSPALQNALFNFAQKIEKDYATQLRDYTGDISVFLPIENIVNKYFEGNLLLPHIAQGISEKQKQKLGDLEVKLYNLAMAYTRNQGYFRPISLTESATEILKEDKNHILDLVYTLIKKDIFTSSRISFLMD
ncbi:MAG TPA: hypothetical protein VMV49_05140 [Candidatus Deferrimicrobium sp.]|nr:hypothetical protein [Candidatus Deferrimicrobium sp.]